MEKEITKAEKWLAGIILILFTCIPTILIICYWPDRLPNPEEFVKPLYCNKPFHIRLAGVCDSISFERTTGFFLRRERKQETKGSARQKQPEKKQEAKDSVDTTTQTIIPKPDTQMTKARADASVADTADLKRKKEVTCGAEDNYIHINTLLLMLVALAGFLGNMIHIATSFTTYVAAKTFVRSWLLWYFVRPFSAAALAVGIYFVFRGGFLNMSDDTSNINLYGVMTISLLTGLFTDRATQKLKEVFEVLFKPTEKRPNPLDGPKVTSILPAEIERNRENILTLTGENLDVKITATINDEPVAITDVTKKSATIKYTIPATQINATAFIVRIKDKDGNIVGTGNLTLR